MLEIPTITKDCKGNKLSHSRCGSVFLLGCRQTILSFETNSHLCQESKTRSGNLLELDYKTSHVNQPTSVSSSLFLYHGSWPLPVQNQQSHAEQCGTAFKMNIRAGAMAQRYWAHRGPEFSSQYPHLVTYNNLYLPAPGNQPFFWTPWTQHSHMYTYTLENKKYISV